MAKLAVSVCVIFSLFLLSYARHLPLKEERPLESLSAVGITVLPLRPKAPLHLRFPYPCRHIQRLRGPRFVSYGNDMLPLDKFDRARLIRSRVSDFHGLPEKTRFGFPSDRHFLPALESRDGGLIFERSRDYLTSQIPTIEASRKLERGEEGDVVTAAPEGGFKKWFDYILNFF